MKCKKKLVGLTVALMIFGGGNFNFSPAHQNVCIAAAQTPRFTVEKANEYIQAHKAEVNQRWYPVYHIAAPYGWVNDPNGFSYFNGEYHFFISIIRTTRSGDRCTGDTSRVRIWRTGNICPSPSLPIRNMMSITPAVVSAAAALSKTANFI